MADRSRSMSKKARPGALAEKARCGASTGARRPALRALEERGLVAGALAGDEPLEVCHEAGRDSQEATSCRTSAAALVLLPAPARTGRVAPDLSWRALRFCRRRWRERRVPQRGVARQAILQSGWLVLRQLRRQVEAKQAGGGDELRQALEIIYLS